MDELISVIVPTYNVELYIARCIESILAQSYSNWELVLINDGSTDRSGKICDDYSRKYQNIHVIHQTNRGVSAARNVGIESAKGEYLLFVDPDDWIAPNMLETMVTKGHGAELIACGYTIVLQLEDGKMVYKERRIWDNKEEAFETKDIYYNLLARSGVIWNKMFRRAVLGSSRFREDLQYGEDTLFLAELFESVHSAVLIPEPLYYYFKNRSGNVMSAKPDERSMLFLDTAYRIYEILCRRGARVCGIRRIYIAVEEVLAKVSWAERKRYQPFILKCGKTLRRTSLRDQIGYVRDRRYIKSKKKFVQFFLDTYLPLLGFRYRVFVMEKNGRKRY